MKIAILGTSGMLGSLLFDYFSKTPYTIYGYVRQELDAENISIEEIEKKMQDVDYIINAIGIIKPYIHDNIASEIYRAIQINALFPYTLAHAVKGTHTKIIHITTDCVYDGICGHYNEKSLHTCSDVYGKTKSLGEVFSSHVINLRCSIIGPEKKGKKSLLEWFLQQSEHTEIQGYANHYWNGITTLAFAKICHGIIQNETIFHDTQHIIPADTVSKSELLQLFVKVWKKKYKKIRNIEVIPPVNRILTTINPSLNTQLWKDAGYMSIPTIEYMLQELFAYSFFE